MGRTIFDCESQADMMTCQVCMVKLRSVEIKEIKLHLTKICQAEDTVPGERLTCTILFADLHVTSKALKSHCQRKPSKNGNIWNV